MLKVKAIKSFIGVVSMNVGDVRYIQSDEVAKDLVKAGYVVAVDEKPEAKPKAKPEDKKTPAKKGSTTKKPTTSKKTKK